MQIPIELVLKYDFQTENSERYKTKMNNGILLTHEVEQMNLILLFKCSLKVKQSKLLPFRIRSY